MRFEGRLEIAAPRERAWEFFSDPRRVSECAPDVSELEVLDPSHFTMSVRAGVGAVKGVFRFAVRFTDSLPPDRIVTLARGQAPGSRVDLSSTLELVAAGPDRTELRWLADVIISGTLATVGSRFIQGAAERTTRQVFTCAKERLERSLESAP